MGLRLANEGQAATFDLMNAQQALVDSTFGYQAALSEAARAGIHSPAQENARRAEKKVVEATVAVGKLEVLRDSGAFAISRAKEYVPTDGKGQYFCPECWVKENLSVGLHTSPANAIEKSYECPTCMFGFNFDSP